MEEVINTDEMRRKMEEILGLPAGSADPVEKNGDKLVKAIKLRAQRELEYLLLCPEYEPEIDYLLPLKLDGEEELFCWN